MNVRIINKIGFTFIREYSLYDEYFHINCKLESIFCKNVIGE